MEMLVQAEISRIRRETPSVKSFLLDLGGRELFFHPGQWVDFYLDHEGARGVAGYTITSSPTTRDTIELTVRAGGENPVTSFLHEQAEVGETVYVDGGQGDFYYSKEMGGPLVLLAGGIGITPLVSILRYVHEGGIETTATLVYSVKAPSEIVFRRELEEMNATTKNIRCVITVTQPGHEPWDGPTGRLTANLLQEIPVDLDSLFYICGPKPMGHDMTLLLRCMGAQSDRIRYEQWW
jgi:ferredoxin-NADP reductase